MTDGDTTQPTTDPKGDEGSKETPAEKEITTPETEAPISLLGKTTAIVERLEAANQKTEELLQRQERLTSESLLGGTTEGGQPVKKKEETPQEYAKKVMANDV